MAIGEVVRDLFSIELKPNGSISGFKGLEHILNIAVKKNKSKARDTFLAHINEVSKYTFRSIPLYCTFAIFLIESQSDNDLWIYVLNGKFAKEVQIDLHFLRSCCEFFVKQFTTLPLTDKQWKYAIILLRVVTLVDEMGVDLGANKDLKQIFQNMNEILASREITDFQLLNTLFTLKVVVGAEDSAVSDIIRSKKLKGAHLLGNANVLNHIITNYKTDTINFYRIEKCCMLYKKNHLISKKLLAVPDGLGGQYCYVQVIHSNIYIWAGSGLLLQIHQKDITLNRTSESVITISLNDANNLPLQIAFNGFGNRCLPTEHLIGIELRMGSTIESGKLFTKINNNFRISEAKRYLLLNNSDNDPMSEIDVNTNNSQKEQNCEKDGAKEPNQHQNTQLHTPERSDLKRPTDEQDIPNEITYEGTPTPKNLRTMKDFNINDIESSPLEGLCKRNLQRQLSRCAQNLKQDLTKEYKTDLLGSIEVMHESNLSPSSSLVITKYDKIESTKNLVKEGRLTSQFLGTKTSLTKKVQPATKSSNKKSQIKDNINMLNTIFGAPKFKIKKTTRQTKNKYSNTKGKLTKIIERVSDTNLLNSNRKTKPTSVVVASDNNAGMITNDKDNTESEIIDVQTETTLVSKDCDGSRDNIKVSDPVKNKPIIKREPMNAFTISIQEQLAQSLNQIANQMVSRITLINEELNAKIMQDLSEKYKNVFHELQMSFQNDVDNMTSFLAEIKNLTDLSESELATLIRERKVIETNLEILSKNK